MRRLFLVLTLVLAYPSFAAELQLPVVALTPRGDNVRIVVTGDTGEDPSKVTAAIGALHTKTPVDAILLLGDNFYDCGVRSEADPQWGKIRNHFSPLNVPIFPVLGNHDYGNPKGFGTRVRICGDPDPEAQVRASATVPGWRFPARNYRIRTPVAELIMVDTTPLARRWGRAVLGSSSTDSILDALDKSLAQSTARWKIVAGHHTIRASGRHGREDLGGEGRMPQLHKMLREHNVDAYLAGHDHHLELISYESTNPSEPIFVISGAGSRLRGLQPRSKTSLPTLFPPDAKSFLGFALLEISPDRLAIAFYDTAGAIRGNFSFRK